MRCAATSDIVLQRRLVIQGLDRCHLIQPDGPIASALSCRGGVLFSHLWKCHRCQFSGLAPVQMIGHPIVKICVLSNFEEARVVSCSLTFSTGILYREAFCAGAELRL